MIGFGDESKSKASIHHSSQNSKQQQQGAIENRVPHIQQRIN
jgi:hypothetical protein